jgi:hypothetical protein
MADILTEIFEQLDPAEQARIRVAESQANAALAQGEIDSAHRGNAPESLRDAAWVLAPLEEARTLAVAITFEAFGKVFWQRTDMAQQDAVREFLAELDRIGKGVLARFGRESHRAIDGLTAVFEQAAWSANAQKLEGMVTENAKEVPPPGEAKIATKRGRKSSFSKDRLDTAHQMKLVGKSNDEIAKTLYGTNTTTPAQRRSVPTILKHHFRSKK